METTRCQSSNYEYNNKGANTIHPKTSADTIYQEFDRKIHNQNITNNDHDYRGPESSGYPGDTSITGQRIYVKNVFKKEIRRKYETNIRSKRPQSVHNNKTLPVDISHRHLQIPAEKRLDDKNRLVTSLLSSSNCCKPPSFPQDLLQQSSSATKGTAVRAVLSPTDLCNSVKLDSRNSTSKRHKDNCIPGRFFNCQPKQRSVSNPDNTSLTDLKRTGLANKFQEISSNAQPNNRIFGTSLENSGRNLSFATRKNQENKRYITEDFKVRKDYSKRSTEFTWPPKLCQYNDAARSSTLSPDAEILEKIQQKIQNKENGSNPCKERINLVARRHREQLNNNVQKRGNTLFDNRRSGCGLGSSSQRPLLNRTLDKSPKDMALQHEGTICCIWSNKKEKSDPEKYTHISPVRQPNSSSTYQKRRRDKVPNLTGTDIKPSSASRTSEYNTISGIPSGKVQRHSRPLIKEQTSAGMAPVAPGCGSHIQKVGCARHRPVRVGKSESRSAVRNLGLARWVRSFLRRIQSELELQIGLGISTTEPNSKSPPTSEYSKGHVHCVSSNVDSVFLASRPTGTSLDRTICAGELTQQPNRLDNRQIADPGEQHKTPSMENWGWADQVAHWSASERQLLRKSWRDSTLTTYKAPINRWTTWCRLNNIDPKSPKGNDLARFLAKLHLEDHLAYRTILLHKSAIITYSAAEELTKNFFVQQVLKAISIMRPIERKEKIWDTEIIFNWLKETPNSGTLFEVSRRTAIILLLASGRRVHDLTLLDIAEENLIEKLDKSLILWPKFGSKTDNANARQSGWLLKQHSDLRLCPVKHVKELINVTLNRRLSENTDINSLFISITGKVKSATRTQIAGWIRTIFKEIDINAPPGSIRAAVASRSYSEQQPIEEILKRGNWRSAATFKKHYCRVVEKTNTATQVDHLAKQFLEV